MLKVIILGIWVIVVTVGAAFGSIFVKQGLAESDRKSPEDQGVEEVKAEMTSVPMIRGGEIVGYLIIQLSFEADRRILAELKLEPAPYLNDAAFRVIFASDDIDFRRLRKSDLDRLTEQIASEANTRLGAGLVRHVLVQQINFVRKEDIRTNWIGNGGTSQ